MGYLKLTSSPFNLSKATLSVWFRVPQATHDALHSPTNHWDYDVLMGLIPIIAFSAQHSGRIADWTEPVIGVYYDLDEFGNPTTEHEVFGSSVTIRDTPMSPCVIGVHKSQFGELPLPVLSAHLQTTDRGAAVNSHSAIVGWVPIMGGEGDTIPVGIDHYLYENASSADEKLEFFSGWTSTSLTQVALDEWHHLLMSWDLGESNSGRGRTTIEAGTARSYMDAVSTMYCALDDENKTHDYLPTLWPAGGGPNEIICDGVGQIAGRYYNPDDPDYYGEPSYSVAFAEGILADGVFIPCDLTYARGAGPPGSPPSDAGTSVEAGQVVEMAELQIFADRMIDTNDEANRRAFITPKIVNGQPDPSILVPAKLDAAVELLGKRPEILLHRTTNWKKGKNTGSLGQTDDGEVIPDGQFEPTGTIVAFKPDPRIPEEAPAAPAIRRKRMVPA